MKIQLDHYYHGAVLNQIAEHEQFTAINALKVNGKTSRSAFKVNNDIAVYLKYATKPVGTYREYVFTFDKTHLAELAAIEAAGDSLYLALVCVRDNEVCCFSSGDFNRFISRRKEAQGEPEDHCILLVTLKKGQSFRVNINVPGKKKTYLGQPLIVPRKACPNSLFR